MIEIIPNWHPVFVHFTVALLITAAAIHLLLHILPEGEPANQLTVVARWNLRIGAGFTLLTFAAGWYAFYTVNHDGPSHLAMIEHRNWAMAAFALFMGAAGWEVYLSRRGKGKGWLFTGLLVIGAGLLLSAAWHGAELVYRHGLGVMSMPKPEGPGHAHDHGDIPAQNENMHHGEGHADSHGGIANGVHPHDAVSGRNAPAADATGATPKKGGHAHAPGTPPHKD